MSARSRAISSSVFVRPTVPRCQDEDWKGLAFLAPFVEHGQPVHDRQAEIEDYGIVVFGLPEIMAVFAIGREVHGIACPFERSLELRAERRLVLDDQQAHIFVLMLGIVR
jgi:hypothetical protein